MNKKEKLRLDETIAKIYKTSFKIAHANTINLIEFYDKKHKLLQQEKIKLEEKEPSKMLKKVHKEWESKKEQLNLEIEETFNKLMEKYTDLENLIGLS